MVRLLDSPGAGVDVRPVTRGRPIHTAGLAQGLRRAQMHVGIGTAANPVGGWKHKPEPKPEVDPCSCAVCGKVCKTPFALKGHMRSH